MSDDIVIKFEGFRGLIRHLMRLFAPIAFG